jgi:hypothetical protein
MSQSDISTQGRTVAANVRANAPAMAVAANLQELAQVSKTAGQKRNTNNNPGPTKQFRQLR